MIMRVIIIIDMTLRLGWNRSPRYRYLKGQIYVKDWISWFTNRPNRCWNEVRVKVNLILLLVAHRLIIVLKRVVCIKIIITRDRICWFKAHKIMQKLKKNINSIWITETILKFIKNSRHKGLISYWITN
jgi:hypothetical protein